MGNKFTVSEFTSSDNWIYNTSSIQGSMSFHPYTKIWIISKLEFDKNWQNHLKCLTKFKFKTCSKFENKNIVVRVFNKDSKYYFK